MTDTAAVVSRYRSLTPTTPEMAATNGVAPIIVALSQSDRDPGIDRTVTTS